VSPSGEGRGNSTKPVLDVQCYAAYPALVDWCPWGREFLVHDYLRRCFQATPVKEFDVWRSTSESKQVRRWQKWVRRGGAALGATALLAATVAYLNREWLIDRAIRHQLASASDRAFVNDSEQFRVLLCGTGSPEPSAARAQACALVSVGGKMFVFDAGEGASKSLADSGVALDGIERVFLTHLHSDHFNGLGALINQSWIWGRSRPLDVVGPTGTATVVDALNDAYAIDNGFRTANMPELSSKRNAAQAHPTEITMPHQARSVRVHDEGGITIDAHLVEHDPVEPAVGYVIAHRGKKVFISGDTMVSPLNMPAMQDADLVVHEAYATHLVRRAIPAMRELGVWVRLWESMPMVIFGFTPRRPWSPRWCASARDHPCLARYKSASMMRQ